MDGRCTRFPRPLKANAPKVFMKFSNYNYHWFFRGQESSLNCPEQFYNKQLFSRIIGKWKSDDSNMPKVLIKFSKYNFYFIDKISFRMILADYFDCFLVGNRNKKFYPSSIHSHDYNLRLRSI